MLLLSVSVSLVCSPWRPLAHSLTKGHYRDSWFSSHLVNLLTCFLFLGKQDRAGLSGPVLSFAWRWLARSQAFDLEDVPPAGRVHSHDREAGEMALHPSPPPFSSLPRGLVAFPSCCSPDRVQSFASSPPPSPCLLSFLPSLGVYSQTLKALCFLFKRGCSSRRSLRRVGSCVIGSQARPACLGSLVTPKLGLWRRHLMWAPFPATPPPSVFPSWVYCPSFENDLSSSVAVLEGA